MYGMYNKIYNYLWIFAFLADLWLYTITIREITEKKDKTWHIIGNVLTLRFLLWVIIMTFALAIAYFLPGYNSVLALCGIAIISLFTIISLLNSAILALMQSYMKIEFSLFSTIFWKLTTLAVVALVVYFIFPAPLSPENLHSSLLLILWAGLGGIIVNTLLNAWYARNNVFPFSFRFDREYIQHIFRISLPYGMALFLGVVYFKVDIILLSLLEGSEKGDISIAYYALPMKIVEVLMVLWWFYLNSLLPSLSESYIQKNFEKYRKLLSFSLLLLLSAGICIWIFSTLFAQQIILIIANQQYILWQGHQYSSLSVFPIVFFVLVFYFISLVFVYGLIAAKRQGELLRINIIVTGINIIWNILIIPYFSFLGSAYITVLSQICLTFLAYLAIKKETPLSISFVQIASVFLAGVLSYGLWYWLLSFTDFWNIGDILILGTGVIFFFCTVCFILLRNTMRDIFLEIKTPRS